MDEVAGSSSLSIPLNRRDTFYSFRLFLHVQSSNPSFRLGSLLFDLRSTTRGQNSYIRSLCSPETHNNIKKSIFSLFFKNNFESLNPSTVLTMNSINYACNLNNQGVDLLVSGESTRAMNAFQSALSLLHEADHETFETTSSTNTMNISCDDESLPFCESTSTVAGLQGLRCYVYDHSIMISDSVNGDTTDEAVSLYIAIVLFNSALTSHSEGTALGQEKSLMKASALYSLAAQLLTTWTMPEDMSTTILTLLALNNKAQIHYDQCDYVQSIDCMGQISEIMGSVHGLHSALNHEDINGLMLNVMILSTPTAAQAA
jgi:hypothetical protein